MNINTLCGPITDHSSISGMMLFIDVLSIAFVECTDTLNTDEDDKVFVEEAEWIEETLAKLDLPKTARVLDIGSSDLRYRTVVQPHINQYIHEPLVERGFHIYFLDLKEHEGVDIALDLADATLPASAFTETYDLILCCNILEHLADKDAFIQNLLKFTHTGTYLMLTVPRVYPKHDDPIDTMYRPTVMELKNFINNYSKCDTIAEKELVITDKQYYKFKAGRWLNRINLLPLRRILRWYLKPLRWKISCILLVAQR